MREIKFKRAFFKENGDFSHFTEWGVGVKHSEFTSPSTNNFTKTHKDLQLTNLLDKNKTKIYEGDIVLFNKKHYEVKYFEKWGMFGLVGKSNYKPFDEEDPLGSGGSSTSYKPYILGEYYQKRMEVVGNLYENPKLLKNK